MKTALLIALASFATACPAQQRPSSTKSSTPDSMPPASEVQQTSDGVGAQTELVHGQSDFALALYQELRSTPGNIVVSPYSIATALAMSFEGARGETANEMASALRIPVSAKRHDEAMSLREQLASLGSNSKGADGKDFQLNIVNRLYAPQSLPLESEFISTLDRVHGTEVSPMDFANAPEAARKAINQWVASQTADKIDELLPEKSIRSSTRLLLINAIYLNAAWAEPFAEANTRPAPFHAASGDVAVPFLNGEGSYSHTRAEGVDVLAIPLSGSELDMVFFAADDLKSFEDKLDSKRVRQLFAALRSKHCRVSMPKFAFDFNTGLTKPMRELGMERAFDVDRADFSGMSSEPRLFISDILHSAFIAVEEPGVEAGAATAVVMGIDSAPELSLTIDKPYLFAIRDRQSGTLLFWGRVANPAH